jgi:hypothetical protein
LFFLLFFTNEFPKNIGSTENDCETCHARENQTSSVDYTRCATGKTQQSHEAFMQHAVQVAECNKLCDVDP